MTKRLSIKSYRKPDNRYSPLDLVICEGETEVDYFSELARSLRVHVHICKGDGTDPKSIVNFGLKRPVRFGPHRTPILRARHKTLRLHHQIMYYLFFNLMTSGMSLRSIKRFAATTGKGFFYKNFCELIFL